MAKCATCTELATLLKESQKMVEKLQTELQSAKTNSIKFELTLQDAGLIDKASEISDTEAICVEQIRKIRNRSATDEFTEGDAKILDLLHKTLKSARNESGEATKNKKTKILTEDALLELIRKEREEANSN